MAHQASRHVTVTEDEDGWIASYPKACAYRGVLRAVDAETFCTASGLFHEVHEGTLYPAPITPSRSEMEEHREGAVQHLLLERDFVKLWDHARWCHHFSITLSSKAAETE